MKKKSTQLRVEELSTPRGNDHWAQKKRPRATEMALWVKVLAFQPGYLSLISEPTCGRREPICPLTSTHVPTHIHTCYTHTHKINKYTLKTKTNRKERSPFANIFTYRVISLALKRFSTSPLSPQYWGSNPEPQAC